MLMPCHQEQEAAQYVIEFCDGLWGENHEEIKFLKHPNVCIFVPFDIFKNVSKIIIYKY